MQYNTRGRDEMSTPLLEMEGTAEEIQARLADFAGQRLSVTVRPIESPAVTEGERLPRKLSITDKILARAEAMSAEERAQMPDDLADQHDHYIYGWPRK